MTLDEFSEIKRRHQIDALGRYYSFEQCQQDRAKLISAIDAITIDAEGTYHPEALHTFLAQR